MDLNYQTTIMNSIISAILDRTYIRENYFIDEDQFNPVSLLETMTSEIGFLKNLIPSGYDFTGFNQGATSVNTGSDNLFSAGFVFTHQSGTPYTYSASAVSNGGDNGFRITRKVFNQSFKLI